MESIILTSRLKLTLVTTAERGSKELEWLHELRSNEQTTWWSISGRSKSIEDTEKVMKPMLPHAPTEGEEKTYRIMYAVHELIPSNDSSSPSPTQDNIPSRLIGLITLRSLGPSSLALPSHLFPPSTQSPEVLTLELGYQYLPSAWGKGFAGESLGAVFSVVKRAASTFWTPYYKVYVRAIVNSENPASQRVMAKLGVQQLGMYQWAGESLFLGGKWRDRDDLWIYGMFLRR